MNNLKNFWKHLNKNFTILAPMDDVTDVVFRSIVNKTARPDVFFTEFTNCEAICSDGRESQIRRLMLNENERPVVAQIWGIKPENFYKTAQLVKELKFDGVDINMGCPQRNVIKSGSGSALINQTELVTEIIKAVKEGVNSKIPVSVKTRIGLKKIDTENWLGFLLKQDLAAITVHGRTAKEMSQVPTHWDEIAKVVELRNKMGVDTLIIGNGDVASYEEAVAKCNEFGVDGVMIGRGIFNDLWVFDKNSPKEHSVEVKLNLLLDHINLYQKTWGDSKKTNILKKFFKIYVNGFDGAKDLRVKLMATDDFEEIKGLVQSFVKLV